jgi:hypothetical protein
MFEWQAVQIEQTASTLAFWLGKTHEDRLEWKPTTESGHGRSAYDVIAECVGVNYGIAATLKGGESGLDGSEEKKGFASVADAQQQLIASAKALADAVRGLDESALTKTYKLPFGDFPGSMMISIPLGNMSYHGGQINYIQCLYGDYEFYFPQG